MSETAAAGPARTPRWAPPLGALVFVAVAILLQRLAAPADGWFAAQGAFAFLGVAFDFVMIFLAAFITATPFLRRFRGDLALRRRLTRAFCIGYWIWQALSFLLVARLLGFAQVTMGLGVFALLEAAVGALVILGAVALRDRLIQRPPLRREETAPVADPAGEPI